MEKEITMSPKAFASRSVIILTTLLFLLPCLSFGQDFTVMTRNLYIGAEIQSLASAATEEEFIVGVQEALLQMAANNFTERAGALAAEIVEKKPHLVGLQEVYNLTMNGWNGQPPFRNYLEDLMSALTNQGAEYYVAATVVNLDFGMAMGAVDVGIIDRDVILARWDVDTEILDLKALCPARNSGDGCNYQNVANAVTPVGTIAFQRGYVGVDCEYGRFINTHLEVREPDPNNPLSPLVQRLQAMELLFVIDDLNVSNPPPGPVIIAGDFNSAPNDLSTIPDFPPSPYIQLEAKYTDAWTLRPGKSKGMTCCFAEDLLSSADLYERIDMIFINEVPDAIKVNVVGNDEVDRTFNGLWPSDHAGVVARIKFAP